MRMLLRELKTADPLFVPDMSLRDISWGWQAAPEELAGDPEDRAKAQRLNGIRFPGISGTRRRRRTLLAVRCGRY